MTWTAKPNGNGCYSVECESDTDTYKELCRIYGAENVTLPVVKAKKPSDKVYLIVDNHHRPREAFVHESVARAKVAKDNLLNRDDRSKIEKVYPIHLSDTPVGPEHKREYNYRCCVHICPISKCIYLDDVTITYEEPKQFSFSLKTKDYTGIIPVLDERVLDQVFRLSYEKLGSDNGDYDDYTWIIDEEDLHE